MGGDRPIVEVARLLFVRVYVRGGSPPESTDGAEWGTSMVERFVFPFNDN